jgi:serine/threonine-protein kinase
MIGHYELRDTLARGGMATVYLAYDTKLQREVALKALPAYFAHEPEFSERFTREAQTISTLEHNAIVPVYDFGEHELVPYLVMRYMVGGTLGDLLQTGPLTLPQAAPIVTRIARAIDRAHQRGILHRDIKPDNILFDEDNNAYLADFGIVKLAESSTVFTQTGNILGTPAYMSPEQAQGQVKVDHRTDIYSLGVVFYEMMTGAIPYQADTPVGQAMMHVLEPVPRIREANPDLPAGVQKIIDQAMAKDREARYPTARALARAVQDLAEAATVPPPPPEPDHAEKAEPVQDPSEVAAAPAEPAPLREAEVTEERIERVATPPSPAAEPAEEISEPVKAASVPAAAPLVDSDTTPEFQVEDPADQVLETIRAFIERFDTAFVLQFFIATAVGYLPLTLVYINKSFDSDWLLYLGLGAALGTAQWLVLRRYFSQSFFWILVTTLAFGAGHALEAIYGLSYNYDSTLAILVISATLGIGQWLVLQRWVFSAGWWIAATLVGFLIADVISPGNFFWHGTIYSITFPIIFGLILSIPLAWLKNNPKVAADIPEGAPKERLPRENQDQFIAAPQNIFSGDRLLFILLWVLATSVGFISMSILFETTYHPAYPESMLRWISVGAVASLAQWLVLQRHFYQHWLWIIASVLGFGIGFYLPEVLDFWYQSFTMDLLALLIVSGTIGILQWLVLRRWVYNAGWWVPATVIGFLLADTLSRERDLGWVIFPILYSTLMGFTSAWLINNPKDPLEKKRSGT